MNPFRALWREARIAYYAWAAREMPPHHPDLSQVLERLHALHDQRHPERKQASFYTPKEKRK